MAGNGVTRPFLDARQRALERRIFKSLDLAAAVADQVVVVTIRPNGLVASCPGAEVDPLDDSFRGEQLEDAVDARNPDPSS